MYIYGPLNVTPHNSTYLLHVLLLFNIAKRAHAIIYNNRKIPYTRRCDSTMPLYIIVRAYYTYVKLVQLNILDLDMFYEPPR